MKTDIRPISVLKNKTADIVREVARGDRTVIITQHGEAKVVVLGFDEFQRWKDAMALLEIVAQGEGNASTGRTLSQDKVFKAARAAIQRQKKR
jgi:prevent-host-death family protein